MKTSEKLLKEIQALLPEIAPAPWMHGCDDEKPDPAIWSGNEGCVAWIQPHGNIKTIHKTGQEFCHADARIITLLRNNIDHIIYLLENDSKNS